MVAAVALSSPTCRPKKEKPKIEEETGMEGGQQGQPYIALQPFGEVPEELILYLQQELPRRFFDLPVVVLKPMSVPAGAYNPGRSQYRSDHFLLSLRRPKGATKVLGIVDQDLYAPGLNFVFGQATLNGIGGVIALSRLRPEFWGEKVDQPGIFLERTLKEAVHELGHSFGFEHCADHSCVMHFSNTIWDTDRKKDDFCPKCQAVLKEGRFTQ